MDRWGVGMKIRDTKESRSAPGTQLPSSQTSARDLGFLRGQRVCTCANFFQAINTPPPKKATTKTTTTTLEPPTTAWEDDLLFLTIPVRYHGYSRLIQAINSQKKKNLQKCNFITGHLGADLNPPHILPPSHLSLNSVSCLQLVHISSSLIFQSGWPQGLPCNCQAVKNQF